MLSNNFFPIVSLDHKSFKNPETLRAENFMSGKFLCLDIKEKENEYVVVFIDDKHKLQVMAANKVKFEGFIESSRALEFLPEYNEFLESSPLESQETQEIKTKGRKKKEA